LAAKKKPGAIKLAGVKKTAKKKVGKKRPGEIKLSGLKKK
jgi:hypothetical protein